MESKEHVVEDIELIILVSSERVIGVKLDKDLVVSWMKLGEVCELDVLNFINYVIMILLCRKRWVRRMFM